MKAESEDRPVAFHNNLFYSKGSRVSGTVIAKGAWEEPLARLTKENEELKARIKKLEERLDNFWTEPIGNVGVLSVAQVIQRQMAEQPPAGIVIDYSFFDSGLVPSKVTVCTDHWVNPANNRCKNCGESE